MAHIPDGFLSPPVLAGTAALSAAALTVAVRRSRRELGDREVPLAGAATAFVFAAQMFNFQVAGGTSGHLLGGVLAAVLLGPWAGSIVMTAVLAVQALVFQDGGILALGANIFNMAVVGTLGGYALYRALAAVFGGEQRARIPAAAIAAWASVMLGSGAMALELGISGTTDLGVALTAMLGVHTFIGIGEALITAAALGFIQLTRADLFTLRDARSRAVA
jgi:cobalt/nickel transport system permease protein